LVNAVVANNLPLAAQHIAKLPEINFRLEQLRHASLYDPTSFNRADLRFIRFQFKTALQVAVECENVQAVLLLLSTKRAFLSRVDANAQEFLNNIARLRINPGDKTYHMFLTHSDRGVRSILIE